MDSDEVARHMLRCMEESILRISEMDAIDRSYGMRPPRSRVEKLSVAAEALRSGLTRTIADTGVTPHSACFDALVYLSDVVYQERSGV